LLSHNNIYGPNSDIQGQLLFLSFSSKLGLCVLLYTLNGPRLSVCLCVEVNMNDEKEQIKVLCARKQAKQTHKRIHARSLCMNYQTLFLWKLNKTVWHFDKPESESLDIIAQL